eukprot:gene28075-biopygen29136
MPGDLSRDLMWLAKMLEVYNGQAVVLNRRPVVRDFFAVDVAGEEAVDGGMGGFFGGRWFAVKWEEVRQWRVQPFSPFRDVASSHINYLELFVIFWALKKWGHLLRGCKEKRAAPNTTSAVFVLPFWPTERFWLELVVPAIDAGLFVVLEYIPEDSDVFTSPNGMRGLRKDCGSTRWPVVLVACPVAAPKGKAWRKIGL